MSFANRAIIACALLVALITAPGAGHRHGQPAAQKPQAPKPALVFSLEFDAGMSMSPDATSGSVIAAWDDGVVVFADRGKPGQQMVVGRLTKTQLDQVTTELTQAGFFDNLPGGGTAPDASSWDLWATHDGKTARYRCMWDDRRFGPAFATAVADEPQRRFARMWALSRVALSFAYPDFASRRPLEEDKDTQRRLSKIGQSYFVRVPSKSP
jgi:hypothetical protein